MRVLINIDVPELATAIQFYSAALGFQLNRVIENDVAELVAGASVIYLLAKSAGSTPFTGSTATRAFSRHWTPVHLDIVVDDIAQAARRALGAGALQESTCVIWRGSKCMSFSDPFGHGFCLLEFSGDSYSF